PKKASPDRCFRHQPGDFATRTSLEFRHFQRLREHGPAGISGVSPTRAPEGAMPPLIVPESFALVLAACAPCFTAPTYRVFCHLVAGWLHCPGRPTVPGGAVAAGGGVGGWRHVSAFHRFFGRARWDPDALGRVAFVLALPWV